MTIGPFESGSGLLRAWHLKDDFADGRLSNRRGGEQAFHYHPYEGGTAGDLIAAQSRPRWNVVNGSPTTRHDRLEHDFDDGPAELWTGSRVTAGSWAFSLQFLRRDRDQDAIELALIAPGVGRAYRDRRWFVRLEADGDVGLHRARPGSGTDRVIGGRWPEGNREFSLDVFRNSENQWRLAVNRIDQGQATVAYLPAPLALGVRFDPARSSTDTRVAINRVTVR